MSTYAFQRADGPHRGYTQHLMRAPAQRCCAISPIYEFIRYLNRQRSSSYAWPQQGETERLPPRLGVDQFLRIMDRELLLNHYSFSSHQPKQICQKRARNPLHGNWYVNFSIIGIVPPLAAAAAAAALLSWIFLWEVR